MPKRRATPQGFPQSVTKKTFLVGLILTVVNAYWVGIASELWYAVYTLVSPFSNAIFSLAMLLVANALLRRTAPGHAFRPEELLLIYAMVTMVSTISGHAMMAILMGTLAHPFWFATEENQYLQLFGRFIPDWFTVRNPALLRGYFEGDSSLHVWEHLRAWMVPTFVWSGFIFALYGSLLCFGLLVRKQWNENEKLSFPLTELPLQMATEPDFFRARLLWMGLAIAGGVRVLAGLHDLIPTIPAFPPNYRLDPFLVERPWNAIGYTSMSFNFAIVGLTYFMPLDLAFSCWFFFWLTRAERVFASVVGWQDLHLNDRAAGAWVGIAMLTFWTARHHIGQVFRHLIGRATLDDSDEPLSYRTVAALLALSLSAVFFFCYAAGMSLWVVVVYYLLFLAFALAIGYVRAALGPPYHEVIGINPLQMMVEGFGSRRLGGANLTVLTFLYAFNRCNRSHPMPNQMEMLRIGERSHLPGKPLLTGMALAMSLGAIATFWTYLQTAYHYGAATRFRGYVGSFGWESFNPLQRWLQAPTETDGVGLVFMAGGLLFVFLLHVLRTRLLWWPLHASGYVLSGAAWGGMIYFWFPVMVSWLLKLLILKFAGLQSYRKMMPFFLGLVLGDFIPRSILSIISLVFQIYMPSAGSGHTL